MSRPVNKEARVRLNLDLPKRTRDRLERVREMSEADSLTEVVKRALSVYDVLLTAKFERNGRILLKTSDGESELLLP